MVEATGKFIPAASANVQHQFPFPGFEAAFRARWTVNPIAEIAISPTESSNTIRLSDRHKAIFHTVSLYERPIRERLRDDDIQVDVWFVVITDEVWRYGRPLSRVSKDEAICAGPTLGQKVARRLFREPSFFQEEMEAAEVYRYELNFHHQLKARLLRTRAVVQVIRESSLNFEQDEGIFHSSHARPGDGCMESMYDGFFQGWWQTLEISEGAGRRLLCGFGLQKEPLRPKRRKRMLRRSVVFGLR